MLTDQLTSTALGVLLHAAEAAPGLHVPRPWRIEVDGHLVDFRLDAAASDPVARVQRIATGAAVFNLRCAAASMNFDSWISRFPYPHDPTLAARIVVEPTGLPDQELQELYAAILSRNLTRPATAPDQQVRRVLERAAAIEDAHLTWLPLDALAVVVTHGAEPADQLQAGVALERVLLTATSHDLRADCLNYTLIRFGGAPSHASDQGRSQ
ncbi:hypothetical protein [Kribbella speibonae]|uniref:Uncharacterized protein n=1 Tax=Kribbella speibonae TaxID=1572660 RepID=A0A4R0IC93_9ACTN|nr:hypothetical protein [Kribbella speibonae]TCC30753.1 hypothetical protein E0H92_37160 [Kribbella speibonae]